MAGIVFGFFATFSLVAQALFIKFALIEHVSVITILFVRNIIALSFWLILFSSYSKNTIGGVFKISFKDLLLSILAGFFSSYLAALASAYALTLITIGLERILFFTFPAFVILFDLLFFRIIPTALSIILLLILQIGLYLVVGGANNDIFSSDIEGVLWGLGNALLFSIYVIINHHKVHRIGSLIFLIYAMIGASIGSTTHFFITESIETLLTISTQGYLMILGYTVTSITMLLFLSESIKCIGSQNASFITATGPFFAVITGYVFLNEMFTLWQIFGGIIVVSTTILLEHLSKKTFY